MEMFSTHFVMWFKSNHVFDDSGQRQENSIVRIEVGVRTVPDNPGKVEILPAVTMVLCERSYQFFLTQQLIDDLKAELPLSSGFPDVCRRIADVMERMKESLISKPMVNRAEELERPLGWGLHNQIPGMG